MTAFWGFLLTAAATCSFADLLDCNVSNTSHQLRPLYPSCYHTGTSQAMNNTQVQTARSADQTTKLYYKMPPLFHLDDYDRCLSQPQGAYCLGSFDLLPAENLGLFKIMEQFSADSNYFNHRRLHRGLCVSSRYKCCKDSLSLEDKFSQRVKNHIREAFGLGATLAKLEFCETKEKPYRRSVDAIDLAFAAFVAFIFLLNAIGTIYDIKSKKCKSLNWLSAWSVTTNLKQLMANHEAGQPQFSEFLPVYAFKLIATLAVILFHVFYMQSMMYLSNPLYIEKKPNKSILAYGNCNALLVVQTYVVVTSFLTGCKLLLDAESASNKNLTVISLPKHILKRFIRITPVTALAIGLSATWWVRANEGPQWESLVPAQEARCRAVWWWNLLYINNMLDLHEGCLPTTWYLAADMQLFVVAVSLTLLLLRSKRPIQILAFLFIISVFGNYVIAYMWDLRASVFAIRPEILLMQLGNQSSIKWMYIAPWGSLPSSLVGLLLAFVHNHLQKNKFKIEEHKWLLLAYKVFPVAIMAVVLSSYVMHDVSDPTTLALYTALDRPVFALIVAVAIVGSLHKTDNAVLGWRGWRVLGKMQLSLFTVHWFVVTYVMGTTNTLFEINDFKSIGLWLLISLCSLVTTVPLYLLVEAPAQKVLTKLLL